MTSFRLALAIACAIVNLRPLCGEPASQSKSPDDACPLFRTVKKESENGVQQARGRLLLVEATMRPAEQAPVAFPPRLHLNFEPDLECLRLSLKERIVLTFQRQLNSTSR